MLAIKGRISYVFAHLVFDMKICVLTELQQPHINFILLGKGTEGGACRFC